VVPKGKAGEFVRGGTSEEGAPVWLVGCSGEGKDLGWKGRLPKGREEEPERGSDLHPTQRGRREVNRVLYVEQSENALGN